MSAAIDNFKSNFRSNFKSNFKSLKSALDSLFGTGTTVVRTDRITGGDINDAFRLLLNDGTSLFMKTNKKENLSFFTAEAAGLAAIAQTKAVGTPQVLACGTDPDRGGYAFLLLEMIEKSRPVSDYWEIFAQQLAAMHRATVDGAVPGGTYGFWQDNYIGARRQVNRAYDSWRAFFCDCRLKPQLERAAGYFDASDQKKIAKLMECAGEILIEPEYPSLLHGDLWQGNVITGNDGRAWLIDPAVYVGCREADLAMTELFGGFPRRFYEAYKKAAPLQPGYERRRDLYNLYHILNHLNLFGRSYLTSAKRIVEEYI